MEQESYDIFHGKAQIQTRIINEKNFTYRLLLKTIKPYILGLKRRLKKQTRILDVGCGVGTVGFFLGEQGFNVLGIDISRKAIEVADLNTKCLNLNKRVKFKSFNFLKEKLNAKFDFVICSEVIEHLENDGVAISRIFTLTKSGGILYISVPSRNAPLYKIGFADKFDKRVGHLRRYNDIELEKLIRNEGFSILTIGKTEGILRNFLFLFHNMGGLVKLLNKIGFLSDLVTFFDNLFIPLFGESNIFILAQKGEGYLSC